MRIFKTYILPVAIVLVLIAIDQITKFLAVRYLAPVGEHVLIEGVFSLLYLENAGMAFGLLQGGRWIFIVLTVIIVALLIYQYITIKTSRAGKVYRAFILVLIGGAFGNFIDRLIQGFVVDMFYISLIDFAVFNVADIYVVVGVFGLLFLTIFVRDTDSAKPKKLKMPKVKNNG